MSFKYAVPGKTDQVIEDAISSIYRASGETRRARPFKLVLEDLIYSTLLPLQGQLKNYFTCKLYLLNPGNAQESLSAGKSS